MYRGERVCNWRLGVGGLCVCGEMKKMEYFLKICSVCNLSYGQGSEEKVCACRKAESRKQKKECDSENKWSTLPLRVAPRTGLVFAVKESSLGLWLPSRP